MYIGVTIVGTSTPLMKGRVGVGRTFQKLSPLGGGYEIFARKGE